MLKRFWLHPVLSVSSRQFYVKVVLRFRGLALAYFFWVCFLSACTCALGLYPPLKNFVHDTLPAITQQMPNLEIVDNQRLVFAEHQSSNVEMLQDANGVSYAVVRDSDSKPLMLYNLQGAKVDESLNAVTVLNERKNSSMNFLPFVTVYPEKVVVSSGPLVQEYSLQQLLMLSLEPVNFITGEMVQQFFVEKVQVAGFILLLFGMFVMVLLKQVLSIISTVICGVVLSFLLNIKIPMIAMWRVCMYANTLPLLFFTVGIYGLGCGSMELYTMCNSSVIGWLALIYVFYAIYDVKKSIIESIPQALERQEKKGVFRA